MRSGGRTVGDPVGPVPLGPDDDLMRRVDDLSGARLANGCAWRASAFAGGDMARNQRIVISIEHIEGGPRTRIELQEMHVLLRDEKIRAVEALEAERCGQSGNGRKNDALRERLDFRRPDRAA